MGRILEILNGDELKELREEVELFVHVTMQSYIDKYEKICENLDLSSDNTKNFYDSVWGTIEINEGEIIILDSPLLQRLRQIKQLGLAYYLYSNADYSRFSHTIGVLQTADVMSHQIDKELKRNGVITEPITFQIIRLAAIFHDCGHMFCSHATERYFQKNRKASLYTKIEKNWRKAFKRKLDINPSLTEIMSLLIVNSKDIRYFLRIIQKSLNDFSFNNFKEDEIIEKISCLILGFPYSDKMIPYAKVISGQIDSDKLDYLNRDSHATGVPVAVDMSRIFQKLRVVASNKERKMIATTNEKTDRVYNLAIAPAAINTVDQFVISRYMMFENIYYHQKTLTAEEMLRYAMLKLDMSTTGLFDKISNILKLTDCVVINSNFEQAVNTIINSIKINHDKLQEFKDACEILSNLNQRVLFKRCVAFSDKNLTMVRKCEVDFFKKVIVDEIPTEQDEFVRKIKNEVIRIKEILKGKYYYNKKTDILFIKTPDISSVSLNSNIAIANNKNKNRDMFFESDKWLESRAARKPQNYLVSYTEDRYLVYIATEYVLLKDYGILINDNMIYADKDEMHIQRLKELLDKIGYFKEFYILAPDSEIDVYESQILELLDKWKHYEIFDTTTEKGIPLNLAYLKLHIKQFKQFNGAQNFDVFVRLYLHMLDKVQIVSKDTINKALAHNFRKIKQAEECEFENLEVCNIGNYQDGSAQIAYHMNIVNIVLKNRFITKDLQKVLMSSSENQVIVFLEDAFCSGKQILSVFETYMGVPKEQRQTQEVHVSELSETQKKCLKKCKLYFSFIFYEKENEDFFYKRMKEIGLENVHIVSESVFPKGYFKDLFEDSELGIQILKSYLTEAGKRLITYKAYDNGQLKPGWDEQRIQNSYLGYNDAQQLIVFTWNTPTYTLTPLWLHMDMPDFKWIPLFPRIDK